MLLFAARILTVEEMLNGLANKQIIIIFLLMILTAGIQQHIGNGFFFKLFKKDLSPFAFRLRMMTSVASLSSILNNTPVVAFMIPFVKSWAEENKYPASKFLIPLSFATILGGMITVVGTSTNLVLNGLIAQNNLPLLQFKDFFFLGIIISSVGVAYLALFSEKLLPGYKGNKEEVMEHIQDYLVETIVNKNSPLIGKTIQEAGLRHLKELFLVEIKRGERLIPAVDPNRLLQQDDRLFFAGNTNAILRLINEENGLSLSEETYVTKNRFFELSEAIIPTGSSLVGQTLKSSNFRDTYKGSVISIYRNRQKVSGNLGEIKLMAGDLLLMLINEEKDNTSQWKDLILFQKKGHIEKHIDAKIAVPVILSILFLISGIIGLLDLFVAVLLGIIVQVLSKMTNMGTVKKSLDLDLLVILICSLALGAAINSSGVAGYLVTHILNLTQTAPAWINLTVLFGVTLMLTTLITNAAAVSIMFPIAFQMGEILQHQPTPYFVAIAFAASADFITPIGYQTNLMVMGPGNYAFRDYTKIGLPLTLIYSFIALIFIHYFYLL
jgi:di/tricarboxylate transporter